MSVERRFFVKVCGLRDLAHAQVATDAGADALGFILAPGRRRVEPEEIASIRAALDRSVRHPSIVGVTVNASAQELSAFVLSAGLEAVQLSGDEEVSLLADIDVPVFKAVRFASGTTFEDASREVDRWFAASRPVARLIVEGHAPGSYGGTGTPADVSLVEKLALRYPIVLAGGLTPDNVGEAVARSRPWGVDVSSGVETDGVKDTSKIRDFVRNARAAASGSSA